MKKNKNNQRVAAPQPAKAAPRQPRVAAKQSFWQFLGQKEQLQDLAILGAVLLAVGVLMRIFYPFPFFFPDSNTYVNSAVNGVFDIYRPMGYVSYLKLLHGFSESLSFVFFVTYALFSLSSLLLLFSAKYLLAIRRRWLFLLMGLCAILSPRLIFSCNFIMSDAIFLVLCTVYVSAILWMICRPLSRTSFLWAAASFVVLWWMCRIRYSGLFFIPISMIAIFIAFSGRWKPLPYLLLIVPLVFAYIFYDITKKEYSAVAKVDTFSGFSGWQSLNNALTLFPEAKAIPSNEFRGSEVRQVHSFFQQYPDSTYQSEHCFHTNYMWSNALPPKQYTFFRSQKDGHPYGLQWVRNSVVYSDYASQLVAKDPIGYFSRYVAPSFWSNTVFHPLEEETRPFVNQPMYQQYYHIDPQVDTLYQQRHFFTEVSDPVRRVNQTVYWIFALLATVFFCATIRKARFADSRFLCLFCLLLSFVIIIAGQTLASPNTTWRYTMPFYQSSVIFMFLCLSDLLDMLKARKAGRVSAQ